MTTPGAPSLNHGCGSAMVLSLDLFRADKGGNPELIKKSQRDRFKDPGIIDKIINLDEQWRKGTTGHALTY